MHTPNGATPTPYCTNTHDFAQRKAKTRQLSRGLRGVQLLAKGLDLVPQLGGVLEAEVVGRREHLLLQLHDRPPELLGGHPLGVAAPATSARGHLRLRHEE